MGNKYKILLVEDEINICNFVKTNLETNGYQALIARNGKNGMIVFRSHCPDLIILDLDADDYVTKPFDPNELMARIRACLRNVRQNEMGDKKIKRNIL